MNSPAEPAPALTAEEPRPRIGSDERLDTVFSKRAVVALVVIGVVSFAAAVGFAIFGKGLTQPPSTRADAYSRSAIGHHAFVELLRRFDVPVVVSQHDSGNRAGRTGLLVIAEPLLGDGDQAATSHIRAMLHESDTSLVVLPKWFGIPSSKRPGWVGQVFLLDTDEVVPALEAAGVYGTVVRPAEQIPGWAPSGFGANPSLAAPQLVRSEDLTPLIWTDEGILLGELMWAGRITWVLSDPDLLNNHGLDEGNNAALAVEVVNRLRAGGAVIFDETLHGYQVEPSLWRTMFEFPLVIATIQVLLTAALLLWAATGRFGAPVRGNAALEPGKDFLIRNTADLLRFGGYAGHTLERYLKMTAREVARELHAPSTLAQADLRSWLDRIGETRGVRLTLSGLEMEVAGAVAQGSGRRVVLAANRIFRWRQEMIHGPSHHSLD